MMRGRENVPGRIQPERARKIEEVEVTNVEFWVKPVYGKSPSALRNFGPTRTSFSRSETSPERNQATRRPI